MDTATLWVGLCSNVQDAKLRETEMDVYSIRLDYKFLSFSFHHHKFVKFFQQPGSESHEQEASDGTSTSNTAHIRI